jgi:hypothetical protein
MWHHPKFSSCQPSSSWLCKPATTRLISLLVKKQFETEFGDWIAAQNAQVETSSIPGAD